MEIVKQKMYHFHNSGSYDGLWQAGNIIDNTNENFINQFYQYMINDSVYQNIKELSNLDAMCDYYFEKCLQTRDIDELVNFQKELQKLFFCQREMVLEKVRKQHYPNLISRKQAIWVCDEPQLEWWRDVFEDRELFELEITGDIFTTSDELLPTPGISYEESIEEAHDYWNPNLDKISDKSLEYLVQGQIKVLKKYKN